MSESTPSSDGDSDGVEVQCGNCGYVWVYTGERWRATCSNCGHKVRTPYHPEFEPDEDEE